MEIFKDIIGYEDYQISNLGSVKSFKCGKEKFLHNVSSNRGYFRVFLFKNGKKNINQQKCCQHFC